MDKEQAKTLLTRYAEGQCTPEEAAQVEAWYLRITKEQGDPSVDTDYAHLYAAAHERLMQALPGMQSPEKPVRALKWLPYMAAAAVLTLVSVAFFFRSQRLEPLQVISASSILPGGNRATLTVAGGQAVPLDSNQSGILMNGAQVFYTDNRAVDGVSLAMNDPSEKSVPLELATPKGGTYQITLPDGTEVWLNAATTLIYPSRFDDRQRVVEISGEGYFSVASDSKRPFIVKTAGQAVEVLGTEFNVSAYTDERSVKTTLIEGAVRVNPTRSVRKPVKLNPGEQSVLSEGATLTTRQVDTDAVTAWKNGRILLTNVPLDELMRQLSRWYNLDIAYQGNVPAIQFEGEITRDVTLEKVLRFLQDSGLEFELTHDRKLLVKERK